MQHPKMRLFSQNKAAEDLNDEELDELFGQLEQFEPPAFMVEVIMATMTQLPPYPQQAKANHTEDPDILSVGNK
jgi:hypothetical protein